MISGAPSREKGEKEKIDRNKSCTYYSTSKSILRGRKIFMQKNLVITKKLAERLLMLPDKSADGAVKHLIRYVFEGAPSESRWRGLEKIVDGQLATAEDCEKVIAYLNARLGTKYTVTVARKKQINARFSEGATIEDFVKVIDTKAEEWMGTESAKYLRPETLFGTKFESYLNQRAVVKNAGEFANSSFDTDEFFTTAMERGRNRPTATETLPWEAEGG